METENSLISKKWFKIEINFLQLNENEIKQTQINRTQ